MRPLLIVSAFLLPLAAPVRGQDKKYPEAGSDLPGAFQPYNVTGLRPQRYHCLVTANGLNPVAVVFSRSTEATDGLKVLLSGLDQKVEKNPSTRMASFAVFVDDTMTSPVKEDEKRQAAELKIKDIQQVTTLKHMALALDSASNVTKYKLDAEAAVTLLLYKDYKVVAVYKVKADEMTPEKAKTLLDEVAKHFGADR